MKHSQIQFGPWQAPSAGIIVNTLFIGLLFIAMPFVPSFAQYELHTFRLAKDTSLLRTHIDAAFKIQDADSAIAVFKRLLPITERYQLMEESAGILARLGAHYSNKDEPNIAKSYLHRGINLARLKGLKGKTLCELYNNLALVCDDNEEKDSAIIYYLKCIDLTQNSNLKIEEAKAYNNLSLIFSDLKDFNQAMHYLKRSLQIGTETNDYKLIANGYLNMGTIYLQKTDTVDSMLKTAAAWLYKGLRIAEGNRDQVLSMKFYNAIGQYYQRKQLYKRAIHYYENALQMKGGRSSNQAVLLINLSISYSHLGNYNKAEEIAKKALENVRQTNHINYYSEIYFVSACIYQLQGKYKEASQHYNESIKWFKKLYNDNASNKVQNLRFQYETAQKDRDLISKQLKITQQQAQMDKNRIVTLAVVAISLLTALAVWLYFRSRYRVSKQQEQQALEIASWRASLEGEEKERRRLAKNLHDNIGGHLSTLKMWLATIQDHMNGHLAGVEQEYKGALNLLDHTLLEVRNTAHHLMPELLLRLGLAEAIRIYCSNIKQATGMNVQYQYLGYIGQLEHNMELLIYRIVQELVQNVVKHARADYLLVQLGQFDQTLSITVEDNGKGMDVTTGTAGDGLGLPNIRNSIEKIQGKFSVHSEPGGGTTVEMELNTAASVFD